MFHPLRRPTKFPKQPKSFSIKRAKKEPGRISKIILEKINVDLRKETKVDHWKNIFQANIYLFKVNIRNRETCEIYSKLTIKTPERRQKRCCIVFIVNFEHVSHLFLLFQL